jgi:GNAT superfamily N-acetyltransferase
VATGRVEIRRVGFRFGTDDELAAMYLVESEIESERWPGRAPQPLEKYLAFARSLPSQFDDHTWLAEAEDGTTLGCSACWSNTAGDSRIMECYVYVRPSCRSQGVGWQLAEALIAEARSEGRSLLVWATYDSVPGGEALSRRLGGRAARINRTSELQLRDLDWELVRSWIDDGPRRARGYALEFWEGPFPADLLDDAATFHHIMNTAPRDDLEIADITLEPEQVAEIDRHLVEAGRQRWAILVRSPDGTCVGGTEMTFESWESTVGFQQNTGIHPAHRGLGLGKWAKATMLARIKDQRPEVNVVRTGNAFSNEPMLAINTALGFKVVEMRTEWQGDTRHLHSRPP